MSGEEIRATLKRFVRLPDDDEVTSYIVVVAGRPQATLEEQPVIYSATNVFQIGMQISMLQEYLHRKQHQRSEQSGSN